VNLDTEHIDWQNFEVNPSGTKLVWQRGNLLIVKGLGVGRTDRSGEGGPPSGIPPLYSVFRGGLNRGSMPRLKFFQKKS